MKFGITYVNETRQAINVTMRRVRVITVAVEKGYAIF